MLTIFVVDNERQITGLPEITPDNYRHLTPGSYFITVRRFPKDGFYDLNVFYNILLKASKIVYVPPEDGKWTDTDERGYVSSKEVLENMLPNLKLVYRRDVQNIDHLTDNYFSEWTKLVDQRQSENRQLWIAGCALSHGAGVTAEQRYGDIVKCQLNLPASWLTLPHAVPNTWAADQILRSDIRTGDTVIWGLSVPYMSIETDRMNKRINYQSFNSDAKHNSLFATLTSIMAVDNICNKLGIRLVIAGLQMDLKQYKIDLPSFLSVSPAIDIGSDRFHPGPKSHQQYATEILKRIQQ